MKNRVVVTGLGVVSSIGIGWKGFWKNLLEGTSGITPISSFDTRDHFTHNGGEVKNFKVEDFISNVRASSLSRASQLALVATRLAMEDAVVTHESTSRMRVGVSIGTTMGSIQTIELINDIILREEKKLDEELICGLPTHSTPSAIAKKYNISGPNMMFSTACAAGNYAIGYGFDLIRLGRTDCVIAGASDPFSRIAFTGFNQVSAVAPEKCQPFDMNRKGMMVAEGAGILLLESLESALSRNVEIYAEVLGYGLSCDAQHMTQPSPEGIRGCMMKAMNEAGIRQEDVDYISAHGTGTVANDRAECAAINEVFGQTGKNIPVSSIKSMLGHTMGAASALEAITCCLAVKYDMVPPTINFETPDPDCNIDCVPNVSRSYTVNVALSNSYAFGGNNASLVLKKYK